jgi:hypothetical protein
MRLRFVSAAVAAVCVTAVSDAFPADATQDGPSDMIDIQLFTMMNETAHPHAVLLSKISSFHYINFEESQKKRDALRNVRRRAEDTTSTGSTLSLELYPNVFTEVCVFLT